MPYQDNTTSAVSFQPKADLLKIFANDQRMILYRPEWRAFAGSVTATILLQQILYRWDKNGKKPFYKFKEPCGHDLYREGDSWTEELGFCRKEFDNALKKIGSKRTAKTNGPSTSIVEYWTDINRVTFYTINPEILQSKLETLYSSDFTKSPNGTLEQKSQKDLSKSPNGTLESKQRLHTEIKNNDNEKPPSSSPSSELTTVIAALFALVPEQYQQLVIKSMFRKALKAHNELYVKQAVAYTLANFTGGTKAKFKAYLGKCLENGWAEGYEPEAQVNMAAELAAQEKAAAELAERERVGKEVKEKISTLTINQLLDLDEFIGKQDLNKISRKRFTAGNMVMLRVQYFQAWRDSGF